MGYTSNMVGRALRQFALVAGTALVAGGSVAQVVVPLDEIARDVAAQGMTGPLKFTAPPAVERVPISEILPKLDAADAGTRDAALVQLLAQVYTLAEIEAELVKPDLSQEQVARLSIAGFAAFCREPRGALGVQFGEGDNGVVISGVIDKFPASKVLKPGDVILDIGGHAIRGGDRWNAVGMVRPFIVSFNEGESAPITVMREKQRQTLVVPLGNFAKLDNGRLDFTEYSAAWAIRLTRVRPAMVSNAITPAQPEGGWMPDGMSAGDLERKHRYDGQAGAVPSLVAGGVPGSRPDRSDKQRMYGDLGGGVRQLIVRPDGMVVNNGLGPGGRIGFDPVLLAQIERQQNQMMLDALAQQQAELAAALRDPGLAASDRRRAQVLLDAVTGQINEIRKRMGNGRVAP